MKSENSSETQSAMAILSKQQAIQRLLSDSANHLLIAWRDRWSSKLEVRSDKEVF